VNWQFFRQSLSLRLTFLTGYFGPVHYNCSVTKPHLVPRHNRNYNTPEQSICTQSFVWISLNWQQHAVNTEHRSPWSYEVQMMYVWIMRTLPPNLPSTSYTFYCWEMHPQKNNGLTVVISTFVFCKNHSFIVSVFVITVHRGEKIGSTGWVKGTWRVFKHNNSEKRQILVTHPV
jgi:hypothetical protein